MGLGTHVSLLWHRALLCARRLDVIHVLQQQQLEGVAGRRDAVGLEPVEQRAHFGRITTPLERGRGVEEMDVYAVLESAESELGGGGGGSR